MMQPFFRHLTYLTALLLFVATPVAALDAEGWAISAGSFDVEDGNKIAMAGLEYRLKPYRLKWDWLRLKPAFGISGTDQENFWIYGSARYDYELSPRWVITPHVGLSLYEEGDGKDLGGVVEFRSGLDLDFRFRGGSRLGLSFYHLSNAGIYDKNPGVNALVLTWSLGR